MSFWITYLAIINNSGNTKATSKNLAFLFFCQQNYLPQWLRALTHMQLLIHVLFSFEWLKYQSLSDDFWSLGGSRSARLHLSAIYTSEFIERVLEKINFHHIIWVATGVEATCKNSVSIFCMKDRAPIQGDLFLVSCISATEFQYMEGLIFGSFIITVACLPSLNKGATLPYFTNTEYLVECTF